MTGDVIRCARMYVYGTPRSYRREPWLMLLRPKLSSASIFSVQSGQIPWVNWASVRALRYASILLQ
jgi:hypothetical protein